MKGYDFLRRLVIIFVLLMLHWILIPGVNARNLGCTQKPKAFWLRNSCHGGFVTILKPFGSKRYKVVASHKGLTKKSPQVKLLKESCHDERSGLFGSVTTRLYSPLANRYICFNKRGKVIAKHPRHLKKMGSFCSFTEEVSIRRHRLSVHFRSLARKDWYLGFRRRRSSLPFTSSCSMKRRSKKRRKRKRRKLIEKCDFSYTTGEFPDSESQFFGLLGKISPESSVLSTVDNELTVRQGSPTSYYYIESNDERYIPTASDDDNEDGDDDDDSNEEKQASFLKFEKQLKRSSSFYS